MADENDGEIDSAMMAAMGFAQFGAQAGQKRKFNSDNAFVDPSVKQTVNATTGTNDNQVAQNASKLSMRGIVEQNTSSRPHQHSPAPREDGATNQPQMDAEILSRPPGDSEALTALRNGVRNAKGDMVYFMPSFIEDPWEHLETM